jgi:hypothetical protein
VHAQEIKKTAALRIKQVDEHKVRAEGIVSSAAEREEKVLQKQTL